MKMANERLLSPLSLLWVVKRQHKPTVLVHDYRTKTTALTDQYNVGQVTQNPRKYLGIQQSYLQHKPTFPGPLSEEEGGSAAPGVGGGADVLSKSSRAPIAKVTILMTEHHIQLHANSCTAL